MTLVMNDVVVAGTVVASLEIVVIVVVVVRVFHAIWRWRHVLQQHARNSGWRKSSRIIIGDGNMSIRTVI